MKDEGMMFTLLSDQVKKSSKSKTMSKRSNFQSSRTRSSVINQDPVIQDQIQRHVQQQFELLTSVSFFLIKRENQMGKTLDSQMNNKHEGKPNNFQKFHKTSTLGRWTKDDVYRTSQLKIGCTEEQAKHMDHCAQKDYTFQATKDEREYNKRIRMVMPKKCTSSCLPSSGSRDAQSLGCGQVCNAAHSHFSTAGAANVAVLVE